MPHGTHNDADAGCGLNVIPIGIEVEVRRWLSNTDRWSHWQKGTVVNLKFVRSIRDTDLHVYIVDGGDAFPAQEFVPLLGELRHPAVYNQSDDHSLWKMRLRKFPDAYAAVNDSNQLEIPPFVQAWHAVKLVTHPEHSPVKYVVAMVGPLAGKWRVADAVQPYTPWNKRMINNSIGTMIFDKLL